MATARRSGDGELIAAGTTAQRWRVYAITLSCSATATITIRSGGASGTILGIVSTSNGGGAVTLGDWGNETSSVYTTAANENLYVSASAGTLDAVCAYTSEN